MNIALTIGMRLFVTIFTMISLLTSAGLVHAKTSSLNSQSAQATVQSQARQCLQSQKQNLQQQVQIQKIEQKLVEIEQEIQQLQGQNNSLGRIRSKRLHKRRLQLKQLISSRQQSHAAARQQNRLRAQKLLRVMNKQCPAPCANTEQQRLRQQLLLIAPVEDAPAKSNASAMNSTQSHIALLQNHEQQLLRRARVVAQRIRSLRRQQELAGHVRNSLRDQSLFDEEERHLQLTRVVQRERVNANSDTANTRETTQNDDVNLAAAPTSNDSDSSPGGSQDTSIGAVDGTSGAYGDNGVNDPSPPPAESPTTTTTTVSEQIHAQRVETLLGDDMPSLLANSDLPDDMQKLRQLRVQLVEQAERLAAERKQLEASGRATRKSE